MKSLQRARVLIVVYVEEKGDLKMITVQVLR